MPKLKIYVHYDEAKEKAKHMTLKFFVPKKWIEGPTSKIKEVRHVLFPVNRFARTLPDRSTSLRSLPVPHVFPPRSSS